MDVPELSLEQYEKLMPLMEKEGVKYYVPNTHCAWRVESLEVKEPDTIEWIDGMKEGEVLWDIGANIGLYSIRAGMRGVKVVAFEPEAQNFAILTRNIFLNNLQEDVTAYPIAVAGETGFDKLHLSADLPGGSCHTFGQETNFKLEQRVTHYSQGCLGFNGDAMIRTFELPHPNHIKIDVDGIEHEIIEGLTDTMRASLQCWSS